MARYLTIGEKIKKYKKMSDMLPTLKNLRKSMNNMLDDFSFQTTNLSETMNKMFDSFDCYKNYIKRMDNEGIKYFVAVPGYSKDEISVRVEGDCLSIMFKTKEDIPFKQSDLLLNVPIKTTKIDDTKVKVENGLMIITIPFANEKKSKGFNIKID